MTYQLPSFARAFRKLPPDGQTAVTLAVAQLDLVFGRPHLHAGLGVRPFGRYFEFRAGRDLRVLFVLEGGDRFLVTVGHHGQIRAYVKNNQ